MALTLTASGHAFPQWTSTTMHLSTPSASIHFEEAQFNKVVVVDNRFDTADIIRITIKKKHPVPVVWDAPLSRSIQNYVQAILDRSTSARNGELLIELRRYQGVIGGMGFSANAYCRPGDSLFTKFASIDTIFRRRWKHNMTGGALDVFIQRMMQRKPVARDGAGSAVSLAAIESNNVMHEWGRLPINTAEKYPPGVYLSNRTLRDNQPEEFAMTLEKKDDSLYAVNFTDTLSQKRKRIVSWLNYTGGWGVISYKGDLYYLLDFTVCVPLIKKNNTFYFHIPSSLPNLYYLIWIRSLYPEPVNWGQNSLRRVGVKDPTLRNCYIDLGAGIIRYN